MNIQICFDIENRKKFLIDELIREGIFKIHNLQLYELSLEELEKEFESIKKYKNIQA
ncbi:Fur-regulated basic protein FbpA [Bacillus sp. SN10]|uniref:Fur-regulated basic protein FbpA n=1 Tax=Bacillus sp. SN10 TaxID=2056493 RepID=UPI000C3449B2|nr:Fur-regulated basic protein FbpA [Bacillus sp. SN10]PKJ52036.1 Fur-regulated basic protein FbpA [Bacillus sp. SN10]